MPKIGKKDKKDKKTVISVTRSFTRPQADGKLTNPFNKRPFSAGPSEVDGWGRAAVKYLLYDFLRSRHETSFSNAKIE